jgi:hypothetical protein
VREGPAPEEERVVDQPIRPSIAIYPMGVGEVIDAGIRLARANYRLLLTVMACGVVPSFILGVAASAEGVGSSQTLVATIQRNPGVLPIYGGIEIVIGLLTAVATLAVILACASYVEPGIGPTERTPSAFLRTALRRLATYIVLLVFVGVALLGVSVLIVTIVLTIFIAVRWSVSYVVLAIEGLGPLAALGRSWGLTKGSWWHTAGVFVVAAIVVGTLSFVIGGIFGAVGTIFIATGNPFIGGVINSLGTSLVQLILTPFSLAIHTVLYYELRARREGFDLAMRARQLPGT